MLTDATGTTEAVWHGLAALGTTGLLIPAEYGGEGMSMLEAGVVLEELGAALHPGPWLSSAVAAPRALTRFGATAEAADLFGAIGRWLHDCHGRLRRRGAGGGPSRRWSGVAR